MPRIYSYIVARDYGFAPNPFHGWCTLATCISPIRRTARPGDWVVGTGSKTKGLAGSLVYAMVVAEALTFDEYWNDVRFEAKKPDLRGSRKRWFGDNIYHHVNGAWAQADSHHSLPGGVANPKNIESDTKVDRVLIAERFTYWGGTGPAVPTQLRSRGGWDLVRSGVGHICNFPADFVQAATALLDPLADSGYLGRPFDW